uniref:Secretory carrier-associated membrane protein n=1 Tax=Culicoides sonorensis TaxID=179676 RepID=A0A336MHN8_CULSO
MSNFEDNPFGEPIIADPFADPSIQRVAQNTQANQNSLENYQPFEQLNNSQNGPAVMQPTAQTVIPTAVSDPAAVTQITTAELQRRQEELERKAQELERREQELRNNTSNARPNNWPPLPAACCGLQPCFYHDIQLDIPTEFQKIVTNLYRLWIFYALLLVVNILGGLIVILNGGHFATFGLSIFYSIIFIPSSFLCWYRPIYKAFQKDSSFNFMVFFLVFFFQFIVTLIQALGPNDGGHCGFIMALSQFDGTAGGIFAGIFLLLIASGFALAAAANIIMLGKVHMIYRASGTTSMAKAQQEFQSEFWRNQTVQNATNEALGNAVGSAFRQRY